MSVRYKLTYWEAMRGHWLLQAHYLRASPYVNYFIVAVVALVFIVAPIAVGVSAFASHASAWDVLGCAVPFLGLVAILILGVGVAALFRCSCLVEIDPDGIAAKSFLSLVRRRWSSIIRLEEDERYLYFGSQPSSEALFLMIPKMAFESRDAAQAFFDQAVMYKKQAGISSGEMEVQPEGAWPPAPRG